MSNRAGCFDVIVVGGGHAGCEAASAASRMGARTALITLRFDRIAQMSCNPAIGGIAKGHLVREIDALGGIMARIADRTGIQFRLLNASRGPAVQAPRCQSDKAKYHNEMLSTLESQPSLTLLESEVVSIDSSGGEVTGVELAGGRRLGAGSVVLTTGTFLNGLTHIGAERRPAGRMGEDPSIRLAENLRDLGLRIGRLKTGTPPRLAGSTIDYGCFTEQRGDEDPTFFSFRTRQVTLRQVSCHIGYTNEKLHRLLRENLSKSALYGGSITGVGPRYCPSIEDKLVKFPDKDRHQIFLEPEGLDTEEVYLNGLSTSMPAEIQDRMVRMIPGLERVRIVRPAYAIEYDFVDPTELDPTLEVRRLRRLFLAGQINGTTGYEEAAALGLAGGINAALRSGGGIGDEFSRTESYLGILIDDLVHRGVDEPYRMFTSRSEVRLLLRIDNADRRLSARGRKLGLVEESDFEACRHKYEDADRLRGFLRSERWDPAEVPLAGVEGSAKGTTLEQLLRRPGISLETFEAPLRSRGFWVGREARRAVEIEVRYQGYIEQQCREAERLERLRERRIPPDFDYGGISGLSREVKEKLSRARPGTLAAAGRIPGVTPAAVSILNIQLELRSRARTLDT